LPSLRRQRRQLALADEIFISLIDAAPLFSLRRHIAFHDVIVVAFHLHGTRVIPTPAWRRYGKREKLIRRDSAA